MPRFAWELLDANAAWTVACVLAAGAIAFWLSRIRFAVIWHHAQAEHVEIAARETAAQEILKTKLDALSEAADRIHDQAQSLRQQSREDDQAAKEHEARA